MDFNARYYSPYLNQFTQPDTIIPDPDNVLDWNWYAYARNNPINYNDSTGHYIPMDDDIDGLNIRYDDNENIVILNGGNIFRNDVEKAFANTLLTNDGKYLNSLPSGIPISNLKKSLQSAAGELGYMFAWDQGFTASLNISGMAFTSATGIRLGKSLAVDGFGHWGILNCFGGGGMILSGISPIGLSMTITNSPSINNLSGWSVQIGGSVSEFIGPGLEFVFFKGEDKIIYVGVTIGGKIMLNLPFLVSCMVLLNIVG